MSASRRPVSGGDRPDFGAPRPRPPQPANLFGRYRVAYRLFCYAMPTVGDRVKWHDHPETREDWLRLADRLLDAGDPAMGWVYSDPGGLRHTADDGLHYLRYHRAGEVEAALGGTGWYLSGPYEDGRFVGESLSLGKFRAADIIANYRALPECQHCQFLVRWVPRDRRWVHVSKGGGYVACDMPGEYGATPADRRPSAKGILAHKSDSRQDNVTEFCRAAVDREGVVGTCGTPLNSHGHCRTASAHRH